MAKGIFTTKIGSSYDDIPEIRYHFPKTYLNQAKATVGDWIIYYEPKRDGGRRAYFATARVDRIEKDNSLANHYYAFISNFLEFLNPVPFRFEERILENGLTKEDGSINRGAFGRSVRLISEEEYLLIFRLGFAEAQEIRPDASDPMVAEEPAEYDRPIMEQLVSRPFRDAAFARKVRIAYDSTCAMTGLKLINGGGRCEIEAAHIRPVGDDHRGPDSVRNGISLSRTVHWMFDRGIVSVSDDFEILMAKKLVPDQIKRLINPEGRIIRPDVSRHRPHPQFLRYHRENIFRG